MDIYVVTYYTHGLMEFEIERYVRIRIYTYVSHFITIEFIEVTHTYVHNYTLRKNCSHAQITEEKPCNSSYMHIPSLWHAYNKEMLMYL